MGEYAANLEATKLKYPFARWRESGLEQYTDRSCGAVAGIFDCLIESLITLGPGAANESKLECFKRAITALNELNEEDPSLIETGEREDLCELCNVIAAAAGMNPDEYGGGEGPASEWRDW